MRFGILPSSLREVADLLLMPGVSIYDLRDGLSDYDHIIYAFPRGGEWHVIVEPPVITKSRGSDPCFPENAAFRIETDHGDACEVAERIALTARRLGRSAIVIADAAHAGSAS